MRTGAAISAAHARPGPCSPTGLRSPWRGAQQRRLAHAHRLRAGCGRRAPRHSARASRALVRGATASSRRWPAARRVGRGWRRQEQPRSEVALERLGRGLVEQLEQLVAIAGGMVLAEHDLVQQRQVGALDARVQPRRSLHASAAMADAFLEAKLPEQRAAFQSTSAVANPPRRAEVAAPAGLDSGRLSNADAGSCRVRKGEAVGRAACSRRATRRSRCHWRSRGRPAATGRSRCAPRRAGGSTWGRRCAARPGCRGRWSACGWRGRTRSLPRSRRRCAARRPCRMVADGLGDSRRIKGLRSARAFRVQRSALTASRAREFSRFRFPLPASRFPLPLPASCFPFSVRAPLSRGCDVLVQLQADAAAMLEAVATVEAARAQGCAA